MPRGILACAFTAVTRVSTIIRTRYPDSQRAGVGSFQDIYAHRDSGQARDGEGRNFAEGKLPSVLHDDEHEQPRRDRVDNNHHGLGIEHEKQHRRGAQADAEAHGAQDRGAYQEHGGHDGRFCYGDQ